MAQEGMLPMPTESSSDNESNSSDMSQPTVGAKLYRYAAGVGVVVLFVIAVAYWTSFGPSLSSSPQHRSSSSPSSTPDSRNSPRRMNLVVILLDDIGNAMFGSEGRKVGFRDVTEPSSLTPFLDHMKNESLFLEHNYVHQACSPTRAALLTGRQPLDLGVGTGLIQGSEALPLDVPTMAEVLKHTGYSTSMVGKWHTGSSRMCNQPQNRGFDYFFGFDYAGLKSYFAPPGWDSNNPRQRYLYENGERVFDYEGEYVPTLFKLKQFEVLVRSATEFHRSGKPFFHHLATHAIHIPHDLKESQLHHVIREHRVQESNTDPSPNRPGRAERIQTLALVHEADALVRHTFMALEVLGVLNDTAVLIMSDNGGPVSSYTSSFNMPYRGSKTTVFMGGVRTPGFLYLGPNFPHLVGTAYPHVIQAEDWLPTLVEGLLGLPVNTLHGLNGVNHFPAMIDSATAPPREFVLHNNSRAVSLRSTKWSYVRFFAPADDTATAAQSIANRSNCKFPDDYNPPPRFKSAGPFPAHELINGVLFDLAADPFERTNVADHHPKVVARMEALLKAVEQDRSESGVVRMSGTAESGTVNVLGLDIDIAKHDPIRRIQPNSADIAPFLKGAAPHWWNGTMDMLARLHDGRLSPGAHQPRPM